MLIQYNTKSTTVKNCSERERKVNGSLLPIWAERLKIQGGSNMTGTNCDLFTHNQSRSYLNHLVYRSYNKTFEELKLGSAYKIINTFVNPLNTEKR
jgi:hypothetical protein